MKSQRLKYVMIEGECACVMGNYSKEGRQSSCDGMYYKEEFKLMRSKLHDLI